MPTRIPEAERSEQDQRNTELHRDWKAGDESARQKLIESNQHLAVGLARNFVRKRGGNFDDAIGAGFMALIRAVDRWEPEISSLTTYTKKRIQTAIYLDQSRWRYVIVPPERFAKASVEYLSKTAAGRGWLEAKRRERVDASRFELTNIELQAEINQSREAKRLQLLRAIDRIPLIEQDVVLSYYGIDRPTENLQAIADRYGCSHQNVWQTRRRAIQHLRKLLEAS